MNMSMHVEKTSHLGAHESVNLVRQRGKNRLFWRLGPHYFCIWCWLPLPLLVQVLAASTGVRQRATNGCSRMESDGELQLVLL